MVLGRSFEAPDVVTATLAGVVTPKDQAELVAFVRAAIGTAGSVRVLLRLDRFAGWTTDPRFDRDALWLRDDEGVSRLAVVGESGWRTAVLTVMAQPLRRVPIEYFTTEEAARRWLRRPVRVPTQAAS
jgi:hypothetical protein